MNDQEWLLLIHQIPPEPGYLRVKIGRRLQRIGAVSIKNSVYVLPHSDQFHEDFEWILREIETGGGEAMVCEAKFIAGLSDEQVQILFQNARDDDYRRIAEEVHRMNDQGSAPPCDDDAQWPQLRRDLTRLKRRLADVIAIDYFGAPARGEAEAALLGFEGRLQPRDAEESESTGEKAVETYDGRTWVTRAGIQIDRIASAWLIRRFIDTAAHFRFVTERGYVPAEGEVRFDMFEAEFTHQGEDCTFEVLLRRMGLGDPALAAIAEIIHDIDLKDDKFGRPEAAGIERVIAGIALARADDNERLARGSDLFDDLLETFRRVPGP